MRMNLALVSCLGVLPAGLAAQDGPEFALPAGCKGFLTVQSEGCLVSHHFICEGDPEGSQRRVDIGPDGPAFLAFTDAETQWIESIDLGAGIVERLEDAPRDRASFSALIGEGRDSYDFSTLSEQVGQQRYVGVDALTGVTQTIDGVELEQTEYRITAYDAAGEVAWASKGNQWISREYRLFLSGVSMFTSARGDVALDNSPVELIFPGEPGFLGSMPRHGCGETVAALPGRAGGGVIPAALEAGQ